MAKREKTIEDLLKEKTALEAKLAAVIEEEKNRGKEIQSQKKEIMIKGLLKYFSSPGKQEELQKILDQVITKKAHRHLFELPPLAEKSKKE